MTKCGSYPGLQLCDWAASSSYGAARCDSLGGGCKGGANNNCYPYILWSGKQVSSTYSWSPELAQGRFFEYNGKAGHIITQAMSVRCVLDLQTKEHLAAIKNF